MHKITCFVLCLVSIHVANGQFSLGGSSDSSSSYPRLKLAGPLGQLIGGQGLSLNSGIGQVLSSLISSASSGSSGGGPLSQLATAASTNYINAIRASLPFSQFTGGNQQQHASHGPQHGHQFSHPSPPMFGGMGNFMGGDNGMYGAQHNFDNGHQFGPNAFSQYNQPDSKFSLFNNSTLIDQTTKSNQTKSKQTKSNQIKSKPNTIFYFLQLNRLLRQPIRRLQPPTNLEPHVISGIIIFVESLLI